jgi:WD40 repeat protein
MMVAAGKRIVSAGCDGRVLAWDEGDPGGSPNALLKSDVPIVSLASSPSGHLVAVVSERGEVTIVSARSSVQEEYPQHVMRSRFVCSSTFQDETRLVVPRGKTVNVISLENARSATIPISPLPESMVPRFVAFANGMLAVSFDPSTINRAAIGVYEWPAGGRVFSVMLSTSISRMVLSSDAQYLAVITSGGDVVSWGLHDSREVLKGMLPSQGATDVCFDPQVRRIAVAAGRPDCHVEVVDLATGTAVERYEFDSAPKSVAFASDGRRLFVGMSDCTVRVIRLGCRGQATCDTSAVRRESP